MHFLYPCDPFDKKKPDEAYEDEFQAAQAAGHACSLYSAEDFEGGEFKPRPALPQGESIIYRGWMLKPDDYARLHGTIEDRGAAALVSPKQYRLCHYLPEWYALCKDLTPETVFVPANSDFQAIAKNLGWPAFFVKDYVKSLTTSRGSIARKPEEIPEIVRLLEKFRGEVEGGISLRKFEELQTQSEERYFVFEKQAYSRSGDLPAIVTDIAGRIDSPFFSVDIVLAADGTPRLMELGDGQVSDRKKWPADQLMHIFRA